MTINTVANITITVWLIIAITTLVYFEWREKLVTLSIQETIRRLEQYVEDLAERANNDE